MSRFQLNLLGGFDLTSGGQPVSISSAKQRALLAILAESGLKPVSRAHLINLLWGTRFDDQARQSLRQALSRLRALLGDDDIFVTEADLIGLRPDSVDCDVTRFRRMAGDETAEGLREAVGLYQGDFLLDLSIREDEFENWRATTASELRDMAIGACIRLSEAALSAGDAHEAVRAAQKAVGLDELREDGHRALISALAAGGRRADAIRHGLRLKEMLRKELGTGLDSATQELLARIQRSEPEHQPPTGTPSPDEEDLRQEAEIPGAAPAASQGAVAESGLPSDGLATGQDGRAMARGERREVTALCYRLVGSTELLTRSGLDDFWEIARAFHRQAADAVEASGGTIGQIVSESGIAYFGYPSPDEDSAISAVAAGLDMVRRCEALAQEASAPALRLQVGIATSLAVVELAAGRPGEVSIIGTAPTLASALKAAAQPNSVVVAESTWKVARRHFNFEYLGNMPIEGLAAPEKLWRPLGRETNPDRFSASGNWFAPMVARSAELTLALDRWQKAASGRGQVILLEGEAGVGKTRLLREFRREIGVKPEQAHVFHCSPRGANSMLHPIVGRVVNLLAEREGSDAPLTFPNVERLLMRCGIADAEAIETLSFLVGAGGPAEDRFRDETPQKIREHAIAAIRRCVDDLAGQGPLLIAVEHVNWADSTSHDLLLDLVEWIRERPILMVLTTRSTKFEDWIGEPHFTWLLLRRLDAAEATELIRASWDEEALGPIPADAVEAIYQRTDGNPLFIEELMQWLGDHVRSGEADWNRLLADAGVATLGNLLSSRLDALGNAKRIAQAAAVVGRTFDSELLHDVLSPERSQAEIAGALEALINAGIVRRTRLGPRTGWMFRHVLIQEAAYQSQLRKDRQRLHARIYDVVAANPEKAVWMDRAALAGHAERAGRIEGALRLYIQAGRESSARSALAEARQLLEHALGLIPQLEDTDTRERLELTALSALGPILTDMEGKASPRPARLYEHGVELARSRPTSEQAEWFPIYWGWWFTAADYALKSPRAQEMLDQLSGVDNDEVQLQVRHCVWAIDFNLGVHDSCLRAIEEGLRLYRPDQGSEHRTLYGGHDAKVCALGQRAQSLWMTGAVASAADSLNEMRDWAHRINHVGSTAHALDIQAVFHRYRYNFEALDNVLQEIRELTSKHTLPSLEAKCLIFSGWLEGNRADPEAGRSLIARGLSVLTDIGTREDFPIYSDMFAEVLERCGDYDAGLSAIEDAVGECRRTGHRFWLAELHRRKAELLQAARAPKRDVVREIGEATSVSSEQGARILFVRACRTALDLGHADAIGQHQTELTAALNAMERDDEVEGHASRLLPFLQQRQPHRP